MRERRTAYYHAPGYRARRGRRFWVRFINYLIPPFVWRCWDALLGADWIAHD